MHLLDLDSEAYIWHYAPAYGDRSHKEHVSA